MNPLLEINPAACLFVIGPQLSHKCARNFKTSNRNVARAGEAETCPAEGQTFSFLSDSPPPPATYNSIFEAGLHATSVLLGKVKGGEGEYESSILELVSEIKKIAAEEGMTVAMERLVELMKRKNCYKEWLKLIFEGEERTGSNSYIYGNKDGMKSSDSGKGQNSHHLTNANLHALSSMGMESIHHLLDLQKQGALLACTQYDTMLDSIAGTRPVTLQDAEILMQWSRLPTVPTLQPETSQDLQRKERQLHHPVGILHLHGVCTNPSSIRLTDYHACRDEDGDVSSSRGGATKRHQVTAMVASSDEDSFFSPGMDILREIFRKRLVIFVGFDRNYLDPLLPGILRKLYPDNEPGSLKNPPILLTSTPWLNSQSSLSEQLPAVFLSLMVSEEELYNLSHVISPGSPKNFTVGKGLTDKQSSDGLKVQAFLLFNEKQSFRKLGDVIYQQSKSGEIYVRRDALTVIFDDNKILYGNLVTYGGNGLRQLWRLVFSEGSTLLGKGLMALGLQNAAIIWTNRKPAELGNVTGINSVHTYAAHKAVHTMAMAQQQQQHSYFISSSGSATPLSSTTTSPSSRAVQLGENSVSLTPPKTAAIASSPQKQSSSEMAVTPSSSKVQLTSRSKASPPRNYNNHLKIGQTRGEQGGVERESTKEDRGESIEIFSTSTSSSDASQASGGCQEQKAEKPGHTAKSSNSQTLTSPATTVGASVPGMVALPTNFAIPSAAASNLTSPPVSTSSALRLNLQPSAALSVAMSNQLLATGLNLSALQPGIATPTGNLAGLVSPVLLSNNPFLTILGASPPGLPKTVATMARTRAAQVGGALEAATATGVVAAAPYLPSQQNGAMSAHNLQLISQLQEKINTQMPGSTNVVTQRNINHLLSLAGTSTAALQAAAVLSGRSRLDHELNKRERQLEMLLMSKTPIHCIASPPEILSARHSSALPVEHTIEYIDNLHWKRSSSSSTGDSVKIVSQLSQGKSSLDEEASKSGEKSDQEDSEDPLRKSRNNGRAGQEDSIRVGLTSSNSMSVLPTKLSDNSSAKKEAPSNEAANKHHSTTDCHLDVTRGHCSPALPTNVSLNDETALKSLQPPPSSTTVTVTHTGTGTGSSASTAPTTASILASSTLAPPALALATSFPAGGYPFFFAVPPTTAATLAGHGHRLVPSPLASSPIKGYYVMNNPLMAAAVTGGSGSTSGTGVSVGTSGLSGTAIQPLLVAAAPPTSTTNHNSNSVQSATGLVPTARTLPLQVPASGLVNATGLIPSLGAGTLSPVPSQMYYYVPDGSYLASAGLMTTSSAGREDGIGKKCHVYNNNSSTSSSSSLISETKAKKRPHSDSTEAEVLSSEAKRIKMVPSDANWTASKHHARPLTGLEAGHNDSRKEQADLGLGGTKAEECVTASDSDDDLGGAEGILMQRGNDKCYSYKGHLQLWEFLLDLLLTPNHGSIIQWTGNDYEFNIVNPDAVVRLWGAHKNKPQMTYEKMSRSLRYYYSQGIMDKVPGKRFTFKFAFDIQKYIIDNKKTSLFTLTS